MSIVAIFGKRGLYESAMNRRRVRPFGKRNQLKLALPENREKWDREIISVSPIARTRLTEIREDLIALYREANGCVEATILPSIEVREKFLAIGPDITVQFDEVRATYALESKDGSVRLESTSRKVLVDYIINCLPGARARVANSATPSLIKELVGLKLAVVERDLILTALQSHHFDLTRPVKALGVSKEGICNTASHERSLETFICGEPTAERGDENLG